MTEKEQAELFLWICRNLLTEEQLDIIPPSYDKMLRELAGYDHEWALNV